MSAPACLTAEQALAVERREGPLLVAAAAGSGKTAVLVERFARAVLEDGVAPGSILAITFTDRAAGELSERLRARFLAVGRRGAARDVEKALVSTFHGFCARVLRAHPHAAGLAGRLAVLDEGVAARMRAHAFMLALRELVAAEREPAVALAAAYGARRLERIVRQAFAELRSRGMIAPRLPAAPGGPAEAIAACALIDRLLARFGAAYEQLKAQRGALDFDDLELLAGRLLDEDAVVRERWRARIALIMVDELQDVNARQRGIVRALERENLFTVGDELQSIYGFRHADVEIFRRRQSELGRRGAALALTSNFRSRPELIAAINAVFAARFGERFTPLVAGRAADGEDATAEPRVELLLSDARFKDDERMDASGGELLGARPELRAEARLVAQRLSELFANGAALPRDVAVLVRKAGPIGALAQALEARGIPVLAGGGRFWRRQEVCDLVAYARALANPQDEVALFGALASPLVGVSADGLALLARACGATAQTDGAATAQADGSGQDVASARTPVPGAAPTSDAESGRRRRAWDVLAEGWGGAGALGPVDEARVHAFRDRFARERRAACWLGAARLLEQLIADSGYERWLATRPGGERRVANARKLVRVARRFEREEGGDLRAFLDHVAFLATSDDGEGPAPLPGEGAEAVRVMTIHAAKGLEFPVVCVADLGSRPSLGLPELLLDGDRIGVRLATVGGAETEPALAYDELAAERREAHEAEEDRILYVALTRARERLLVSGVARFDGWPQTASYGPIAWVGPALVPDLPERVAAAREGAEAPLVLAGAACPVRSLLSAPANLGTVLRREWAVEPATPSADAPGLTVAGPGAASRAVRGRTTTAQEPPPPLAAGEITYSALGALDSCGYRYYLEELLGLPEPPGQAARPRSRARGAGEREGGGERVSGRERGVLVHAVLESAGFASAEPLGQAAVERAASEHDIVLGEGEAAALARLLAAARESAFGRRLATVELAREQGFAFALAGEERLVSGAIDAIALDRDGGPALVVDYKSDRLEASEEPAALVAREYDTQRLIYALAALHAGAPSVEVAHWFLERPAEPVTAFFDAAERQALEAELRARIARARERGYAVSDRPDRRRCGGCPGRGTLCSWSRDDTSRPPGSGPLPRPERTSPSPPVGA